MTFWIRRRRESEPHPAAASPMAAPAAAKAAVSALWHDQPGRFARATPHTSGARVPQAIGAVASAQGGGEAGTRAEGDAPGPDPAASPRGGDSSSVTQDAVAGSPPDRERPWTAEIEWRHESEARFCVIARGDGETAVVQSAPLEWPPAGAEAVQAMTDATEELEATLVAAGWKPLPRGRAWYAKRFAWEPVVAERPETAPVTPVPKAVPDEDAKPPIRQRVLWIALLCALIAFGPITALQLRGGNNDAPAGNNDAPAVRATPTPGNGPADTGTTPTAKPKTSEEVDLTTAGLILLCVVVFVVVIRWQAREPDR